MTTTVIGDHPLEHEAELGFFTASDWCQNISCNKEERSVPVKEYDPLWNVFSRSPWFDQLHAPRNVWLMDNTVTCESKENNVELETFSFFVRNHSHSIYSVASIYSFDLKRIIYENFFTYPDERKWLNSVYFDAECVGLDPETLSSLSSKELFDSRKVTSFIVMLTQGNLTSTYYSGSTIQDSIRSITVEPDFNAHIAMYHVNVIVKRSNKRES